ncbi:MAG TPA: hypothetical protein VNX15_13565 [Gemmatimonadales bacterium]|jgi:hypothetical protein|nr:hypothetical protein [Gemmatimonadales bacterium]
MRAVALAVPGLILSLGLTRAPSPAGTWKGGWDSPDGSVYSAVMTLTATGDSVDGSILWTLTQATRTDLKPKISQHGTEFVRGVYHIDCHVVQMAGYRLDDPNHILGMDHYELVLAPNGAGLGGVTENNGTWTGMISLRH